MTTGVGLTEVDLWRSFWGLAVFLAPGAAWTWALLRDLGWARAVPVALLLAFTLVPAALAVLNLLFSIPTSTATSIYLSIGVTLAGVAVAARPWFLDRMEPL